MTIPKNEYQNIRPLCINCGANLINEMERDSTEGGTLSLWPNKCPNCGLSPLKLRDYIDWQSQSEHRLARVFDANGKEYKFVHWCEISTGAICYLDNKTIERTGFVPAPLTVIFES